MNGRPALCRSRKSPTEHRINAWLWRWELFKIHLRYGWKLDRLLADSLALNEDVLKAMYDDAPTHREIMRRVQEQKRNTAGIPGYYPTNPGYYYQPSPHGGNRYD